MAEAFLSIVNKESLTLVDFHAEWCGPCKAMKPILEDLKSKIGDRARVLKINVDKSPDIANQFRVKSIPTLILFKKGKVVWRQTGVVPAHQLQQIINQYS